MRAGWPLRETDLLYPERFPEKNPKKQQTKPPHFYKAFKVKVIDSFKGQKDWSGLTHLADSLV